MRAQLAATIETNLAFYRRNRLLVAAAVFIILVSVLTTIPALLFYSKAQHLDLVKVVLRQLTGFATVVTAGLGLLLVSQHIRDRSVKMVFTKPCRPEIWLLANLLSGGLVALVLFAGAFLVASALFAVWGIPFQSGIVYIVLNEFFQALSILSFTTFLSVALHPVLAVLVILVFREELFYWLKILLAGALKTAGNGPAAALLHLAKFVADAAYFVWPTFSPYAAKMTRLYGSLRGSDADWTYLALAAVYSLVLSALFFFLTDFLLKRKRYV